MLLLPLAASFNWPEDLMHRTNYLSCFYVAGRLVWEGRASEIYPDISATPFATAPLNRFAYELLPYLRPNDISA